MMAREWNIELVINHKSVIGYPCCGFVVCLFRIDQFIHFLGTQTHSCFVIRPPAHSSNPLPRRNTVSLFRCQVSLNCSCLFYRRLRITPPLTTTQHRWAADAAMWSLWLGFSLLLLHRLVVRSLPLIVAFRNSEYLFRALLIKCHSRHARPGSAFCSASSPFVRRPQVTDEYVWGWMDRQSNDRL